MTQALRSRQPQPLMSQRARRSRWIAIAITGAVAIGLLLVIVWRHPAGPQAAGGAQMPQISSTLRAADARWHDCALKPSRCGYPDATSTGVPSGTTLTPYLGPGTIDTEGSVIDGKLITQPLEITARNVTIRNSRIAVPIDGDDPITVDHSGTGAASLLISDSDISGGHGDGIGLSNWQGYRLNIHDFGGDGCKLGNHVVLRDSYIHHFKPVDGAHADGCQLQSASHDVQVLHNTVIPGSTGHSALMISDETGPGPAAGITIASNLLSGGNYTLAIGDGRFPTTDLKVTGNRIVNGTGYGTLDISDQEGRLTSFSGNRDDHTNHPLTLGE